MCGRACVWGCAFNENVFSTFRLFQLYFLCILDSDHCNILLQIRWQLLVTLDEIATINLETFSAKLETILQWIIAPPKCLCLYCWMLNLILFIYLPKHRSAPFTWNLWDVHFKSSMKNCKIYQNEAAWYITSVSKKHTNTNTTKLS